MKSAELWVLRPGNGVLEIVGVGCVRAGFRARREQRIQRPQALPACRLCPGCVVSGRSARLIGHHSDQERYVILRVRGIRRVRIGRQEPAIHDRAESYRSFTRGACQEARRWECAQLRSRRRAEASRKVDAGLLRLFQGHRSRLPVGNTQRCQGSRSTLNDRPLKETFGLR
jgi:hypothetical protein